MDKDAMITYLIGELKKENLELHDLIIPASQSAGITGVSHHAWPIN